MLFILTLLQRFLVLFLENVEISMGKRAKAFFAPLWAFVSSDCESNGANVTDDNFLDDEEHFVERFDSKLGIRARI